MTGEKQGINWNESHADTPAKTKNPHFYVYNPQCAAISSAISRIAFTHSVPYTPAEKHPLEWY
ncbi:MAG: hypothetical protein ABF408_06445 [Bifidobacterium aquikefiri]